MLDTATSSLSLMSQRADGGMVRATAPHAVITLDISYRKLVSLLVEN